MAPLKFELEAPRKVWLCNCKHTKTPPFCDGSHKALP
jgi:CDGSH-type Zn-finger protein